ncbi:MBL-fold metallo-hydrolase Vmh [Vibrio vulnificus]|uniref:MBL-fold metallo-hydrolase Vmh n=1 Tax=Vibrio vulnificus TaxID=672 RepID=UPI0002DD40E5|nr:MBL-fold metallo-hydrolase Vmh [Vibrio vulnificus]AVX01945.1 MBL fold metallo-hydrolase [Vibrio vulnificus Env1]EGQ7929303.1 MBL fold metallo-hydrolase [Vibrio vulnificus]EGQ7983087.1 MBL fold metallo-hydrolase [Vibrio vulnificus]EGQ9282157.1 MBL fold metallo-hydrolase [Vibrio vulnificus]EGQ9968921.1 MBL fold metallo-hydrolase [Vibrio vulnificus]
MKKILAVAVLATLSQPALAALKLTTYNPQEKAIFPVSSTLISGKKEAILFDAQFSTTEGKALVELIRQSGKELTTVYITGGDPDFYFGLQPIVEAFPQVKIKATATIVDHINHTKDQKIGYWGPILGEGAPSQLYVPEVYNGDIVLEGEKIELKEAGTHNAYYWIPSLKTALGGVSIYSGIHVWMADSQTKEERLEWVASLDRMKQLKPKRVIPGHYLGQVPPRVEAVDFTKQYVMDWQRYVEQSSNSTQLIEKITAQYPLLTADEGVTIGAKVSMGEMKW